ncbi:MAG: hypothetical protein R3F33_05535 [Planctomycetota bacterium]
MAPRLLSLAALLAGVTLAAPAARAQALPEQNLRLLENRFMDQVLVVVGDQVVTRRDLLQHVQSGDWRRRMTEIQRLPADQQPAAERRMEMEATAELVEAFLETRAGQDRGFDPKLVEDLVKRRFDETIESTGGYRRFHQALQNENLTPDRYKDRIRRSLYRFAWQGATTGRQPGPTGRIELDRFVRPGILKSTYRQFLDSPNPTERKLVGAQEGSFVLRELAFGFANAGGRDGAIDTATQVAENIRSGRGSVEQVIEVWARNVPEIRERATLNLTRSQLRAVSRANFGGGELEKFAMEAEPGALSPLIESEGAVHLFKLVERTEGRPPQPFDDYGVQQAIEQYLQDRQMRSRIGQAHEGLVLRSRLSNRGLAAFMLEPDWLYREK